MKRLLLLIALALPALGLYSCVTRVKVPTPASIVQEAHEAFPTPVVPTVPQVTQSVPVVKPVLKHKAKRKLILKAPVPLLMPPPQQAGCIFPLNLFPNCTPGVP